LWFEKEKMQPMKKKLVFSGFDSMRFSIITVYEDDIGNISSYENTVMIFCSGIGIAWSMAAIFWAAQGEKFLVPVGR
jgi:hypothetical protein